MRLEMIMRKTTLMAAISALSTARRSNSHNSTSLDAPDRPIAGQSSSVSIKTDGDMNMNGAAPKRLPPYKKVVSSAVALLIAGAIGGWASMAMSATDAAIVTKIDRPVHVLPHDLVGSYEVTGTDPDGKRYPRAGIIDISLSPSGALEMEWDNGKRVGVGRVIGDVLTVASSTNAGTVIMLMTIGSDEALSGHWSRRNDRGYQGTETWKKK